MGTTSILWDGGESPECPALAAFQPLWTWPRDRLSRGTVFEQGPPKGPSLSRDRVCGGTVFAEGAALHRQRRSLANDGPSPERFPRQRGSLVKTSLLKDGPYAKTVPPQRGSLLMEGPSSKTVLPQRRSLLKDGWQELLPPHCPTLPRDQTAWFPFRVNYKWPPSLDGSAGRQEEPLADTRPNLCVSSDNFVVIQIFRWLRRRNPNQKKISGVEIREKRQQKQS